MDHDADFGDEKRAQNSQDLPASNFAEITGLVEHLQQIFFHEFKSDRLLQSFSCHRVYELFLEFAGIIPQHVVVERLQEYLLYALAGLAL